MVSYKLNKELYHFEVEDFKFPIKEYKTVRNDVVLPFNWALGTTWIKFFDGLKEEKIFGTKCENCKKVFVPPRTFCPGCYKEMDEWVEVGPEGTVDTWCLVNYEYYGQIKKPPYIIAQIHLDGADCDLTHFIGGFDIFNPDKAKKKIKTGIRVNAVWNKEKHADIYDIAYFEPVEK